MLFRVRKKPKKTFEDLFDRLKRIGTWEEKYGDDSDGTEVDGNLKLSLFSLLKLNHFRWPHQNDHWPSLSWSWSWSCLNVDGGPDEKSQALRDKAGHDRNQQEHEESDDGGDDDSDGDDSDGDDDDDDSDDDGDGDDD